MNVSSLLSAFWKWSIYLTRLAEDITVGLGRTRDEWPGLSILAKGVWRLQPGVSVVSISWYSECVLSLLASSNIPFQFYSPVFFPHILKNSSSSNGSSGSKSNNSSSNRRQNATTRTVVAEQGGKEERQTHLLIILSVESVLVSMINTLTSPLDEKLTKDGDIESALGGEGLYQRRRLSDW